MPVKEYLEAEDTSRIEDVAQYPRDKLLIRLLRRLGCRISEVLGIEEKHIDFTRRLVRIEHEKIRIKMTCPNCKTRGISQHLGKHYTVCPQCSEPVAKVIVKEINVRHLRKIPIDRDTLRLIREYIDKGGVEEVNGKRLLFNISRQWAYRIVVTCAERAGYYQLENPENERLHRVSPHKFRDAFAINAIKKRPSLDDARLLQEILGHQKIGTTLQYRKVASAELQEYYDDLLGEEKGGK